MESPPASADEEASVARATAFRSSPRATAQRTAVATRPRRRRAPGASAVGRTAISANGQEVAFVTTAVSDLVPTRRGRTERRWAKPRPAHACCAGRRALPPRRRSHGRTRQPLSLRMRAGRRRRRGRTGASAERRARCQRHRRRAHGAGRLDQRRRHDRRVDRREHRSAGADAARKKRAPPTTRSRCGARSRLAARRARRVTGGSDPGSPACVASGETSAAPESENAADPCQGPFLIEPSVRGSPPGL